jgi:4-amino-4-deoxy-L-arabinose transferase-like glycosyltransferase
VRLDYASREPPLQPLSWRIDRWLLVLMLAGLALRLAWVLRLPVDAATLDRLPDQQQYLELGRNLLQRQGLQFVDPRFGDAVYAFRTPGYPLFVALCRGDIRIVRSVQTVIDASTILAVYMLARRWAGRAPALLSAAIIAFNPFLIFFCGLLLTETLFTAMLIWGMTLLVVPARRLAWLCGTMLLVLSVHLRPSALLLPVCLSLIAAFVNRDRYRPYQSRRWHAPVGTLTLLLTGLVLLPWAWRNNQVLGSWIWTTTNSGLSLYDGLNPDATGASDQTFVRTMPQLKSMDEVGRSCYLSDLAGQYLREHPQRVLLLTTVKIARMWSPFPLSREYGSDPKLLAVAALYMIPLYVLIILGIRYGLTPQSVKVYLLAPAVYLTIVHAASVGSIRYRIPADVPMAVLAGLAVESLVSRRKDPTEPSPAVPEQMTER